MKSKRSVFILHTVDGDVEVYRKDTDCIYVDYIKLTTAEATELSELLLEVAKNA